MNWLWNTLKSLFQSSDINSKITEEETPIIRKTIIKRNATPEEHDNWVNRADWEFGCKLICESIRIFNHPHYNTMYTVNDRIYVGYRTILKEKTGSTEDIGPFKCNRISRYIDKYGSNAIVLVRDIPCFDSYDSVYDSEHLLIFFHDENSISALYCGEGYELASLVLFKSISPIGDDLIKLLKDEGFPV